MPLAGKTLSDNGVVGAVFQEHSLSIPSEMESINNIGVFIGCLIGINLNIFGRNF